MQQNKVSSNLTGHLQALETFKSLHVEKHFFGKAYAGFSCSACTLGVYFAKVCNGSIVEGDCAKRFDCTLRVLKDLR